MADDAPQSELPPVPTFDPAEQVCGNCKLWQAHSVDARGWVGPCRLQPQRGLFPPSAPTCDAFVARGAQATSRPAEREQRPRAPRSVAPVVVRHGTPVAPARPPPQSTAAPSAVATQEPPRSTPSIGGDELFDFGEGLTMNRDDLIDLLRQAAGDPVPPPMANKWQGGVVQLIPGNKDLQAKELPIDALFHKVVMIRDRLRTLEQRINAHAKLADAEKVELQAYITRVYGSLTSFNLLFRDKNDQFVGMKGDE